MPAPGVGVVPAGAAAQVSVAGRWRWRWDRCVAAGKATPSLFLFHDVAVPSFCSLHFHAVAFMIASMFTR